MGISQAPQGLIPIKVDGQLYNVDQEAIDDLKAKGIPYDDGHDTFKSSSLSDAARGAAHGATLGFADTKFGEDKQSVMQRLGGDDYDAVKERSPVATTVGDFAGGMAIPVPGTGAAKAGATGWKAAAALMARRAAEQAVVGGTMGGARAIAEGEDPTQAAGIGAVLGGAGSAALELGGAAATAAKPWVAKGLNAVADAARTRPFGIGGSDAQLSKIAAKFGVDELPANIAKMIEEHVPPEGLIGRNREEYRKALEPIIDREGQDLGALRQHIGQEQGVNSIIPAEYAKMRQNMQDEIASLPTRTAKQRELVNAMQKDLEAFDKQATPRTLTGLANVKSQYQADGHIGPMGTVPEKAAAQSSANFGSEGKNTISRLLDYSTDDVHAAHDLASKNYGEASTLYDQIEPKAVRDRMNTNAAKAAAAGIGAVGGAIMGAGTAASTDHSILGGAAIGGLGGALSSTNTGTRNLMTQLLEQPKAMDTIANITRASGRKLSQIDLNKLTRYVQSLTGKVGGFASDQ